MRPIHHPQHGVGARLRAERERRGLTQQAVGMAADITKRAQQRYENGLNSPTARYLHAAAALGVDMGYVLTGLPSELCEDERLLLARYRATTEHWQCTVRWVLNKAEKAAQAEES